MTALDSVDPRQLRAEGAVRPKSVEPDMAMTGDHASEGVLRQWLRILLRWRWVVIGAVAIAVIAGIAVTLLMTRLYTASASLEISRDDANIVNIEGVEPTVGSLDQEFYQTQYGLLRSRTLAEGVATELQLQDSRSFFEIFGEGESMGIFSDARDAPLPREGRADRLRKAADILLDNLAVSPLRASRLVTVSFQSPDADLSARVANAWGEKFIQQNLQRRIEATSYARTFLESRLAQTRQRLEASERQLVGYSARNNIIILNSPSGQSANQVQERSVVTDSLIATSEQLAAARGQRIVAESRLQRSGSGTASPEVLANPAIATLRQRRAEAAAEHARLLAQFEPRYPPAQALGAQVQQLDAAIAREESRVRAVIRNQYQEAVERERQLEAQAGSLEGDVISQRRRGIQYNIFQREVDTNRQLYDALLQRYKEIGVAGGVGTNNIALVDRALPPIKPSQPRPLINLFLAILAGFVAGIGLAFALEQIDEALSDPNDVERVLKVPALGSIPKLAGEDPLVALEDRKSPLAEAYLSVETSLKFSTPAGLPKSLLVTSTRPGEGKSTSSVAIAVTLARLGYKTLLIDADMRSPSLHTLLGTPNTSGLSDMLSGNAPLKGLIRDIGRPNLSMLPAGPTPPNAAELLSSGHLDELLAEALASFDTLVIDAPPVMGLADAPLIASKTAGTLMVVESSGARSRQVQMALRRLQNARANVLGAVLTKFDAKKTQYGYGYDYGYGYGHDSADGADPAVRA